MTQRLLILISFVMVLALPVALRFATGVTSEPKGDGDPLIIVTPHVEQIREEFARGFERWHLRNYGEPVRIDWRVPGGTSEIVRQLEAQFMAAAKNGMVELQDGVPVGKPGAVGYDIFFGGGTYEHSRVKNGVNVQLNGEDIVMPMSTPTTMTSEELAARFGENKVGSSTLYDPDQYWTGTALSGFGIVYNRELFARMGLPEPTTFHDLTDPKLVDLVALANPRMSGSVTTTYESILKKEGWNDGWRLLKEMCANARYFASSSTRPPMDVSQGDAAAGLAIDFYGRGQAQAVLASGETAADGRVGYVDPKGAVYIDPDPISILSGAPNPELAQRFVRFSLTDEAQTLWQLPALSREQGNPRNPDDPDQLLGPSRYELRRMPIIRGVYERYGTLFIDQVDPFELAAELPQQGWRSAITPLMVAFGIDAGEEMREAWNALNRARNDESFPKDALAEMEHLFYAMPEHKLQDGNVVPFDAEHYDQIKNDTGRWKGQVGHEAIIAYTAFFRESFEEVVRIWRTHRS